MSQQKRDAHTHSELFNPVYLLQRPHMQQTEKQRYIASIQRQQKVKFIYSADDGTAKGAVHPKLNVKKRNKCSGKKTIKNCDLKRKKSGFKPSNKAQPTCWSR